MRGFAVKFYTEEGNWDLVGNNTPVFFIRDPLKSMARRGLIEAGVKGKALAFETMPFVVGFYEMQLQLQ